MKSYLQQNALRLVVAVAIVAALGFGVIDPAAAGISLLVVGDTVPSDLKELNAAMEKAFGTMKENLKKLQDQVEVAREDIRKEGTLHGDTNKKLTEIGETGTKCMEICTDLKARVQDVEQKLAHKPGSDKPEGKSIGEMLTESDAYKAMIKSGDYRMSGPVKIGSFHFNRKTAITEAANATTGTLNPLVQADRIGGVVMPGLRRLTIRDLIPTFRTSSNMVEYVKENVFTNNAGAQYDTTSPTPGQEGAPKNESGITFSLSQVAVTTLAHWVPVSRQAAADSTFLMDYIDSRLRYGLKLEEEDELLNSTGTNGELNGLLNQATAFTGGATNQKALDTLLKAFTQISLSEFEANGVVLHPKDWQDIMLTKDTTGRYLFSDPHSAEQPRVWGKPVIPTQSIAVNNFLAGAFGLAAGIYDREDSNVRVSDQHADFFTRNLVAVLCEERLALVVFRATAIVKGAIDYTG